MVDTSTILTSIFIPLFIGPVTIFLKDLWDRYTAFKEQMFSNTHTSFSPWIIVQANNKKKARLESIRYVLDKLSYDNKADDKLSLLPDPNIVSRYDRRSKQRD